MASLSLSMGPDDPKKKKVVLGANQAGTNQDVAACSGGECEKPTARPKASTFSLKPRYNLKLVPAKQKEIIVKKKEKVKEKIELPQEQPKPNPKMAFREEEEKVVSKQETVPTVKAKVKLQSPNKSSTTVVPVKKALPKLAIKKPATQSATSSAKKRYFMTDESGKESMVDEATYTKRKTEYESTKKN